MGKPLVFEHAADDREAVKLSPAILIGEIERLMERSAKRLLDASRPLATGMREPSGSATKHIRLPADQDLARIILKNYYEREVELGLEAGQREQETWRRCRRAGVGHDRSAAESRRPYNDW